MGLNVGQTGRSANVVNHHPFFLPKIQSFSEKPEDRWNFIEFYKLQSKNLDIQSVIASFRLAIGNDALCWFNDVKAKGKTEI